MEKSNWFESLFVCSLDLDEFATPELNDMLLDPRYSCTALKGLRDSKREKELQE